MKTEVNIKDDTICMYEGCNDFATKDYNSHEYYVCEHHFDKLNDEFDDEYN